MCGYNAHSNDFSFIGRGDNYPKMEVIFLAVTGEESVATVKHRCGLISLRHQQRRKSLE
jgi:hypothetical protein